MSDFVQTERTTKRRSRGAGDVVSRAGQGEVGRHESASAFLLRESLNQSPRARSLAQLRQALDGSPRVQSLHVLQMAANQRAEVVAQGGLAQRFVRGPARSAPAAVQRRENETGLPDHLRAGIEQLSGLAMDNVRVRYNSAKPARIQAYAYTQGSDIHVGPGQEKHLPHEAWHAVQQKQGRVKPTLQAKDIAINDDAVLEREADVMGAYASAGGLRILAGAPVGRIHPTAPGSHAGSDAPIQGLWKELLLGALLLLGSPVGFLSNKEASIRRRPLGPMIEHGELIEAFGVHTYLEAFGIPYVGPENAVAPDTHERPENLGWFHEHIFLSKHDESQNVGRMSEGIRADAQEFLQHYSEPVIADLDSGIMRVAVDNVREKWEGKKYHLTESNCQHFTDEVLQEYYRLVPSFKQDDWGIWIADKLVEVDDTYINHINDAVSGTVGEKLKGLDDALAAGKQAAGEIAATLQGHPQFRLALETYPPNFREPIELILGQMSTLSQKGDTEFADKARIKQLVSIVARQEIENELAAVFPPWMLGVKWVSSAKERLYNVVVDRVATEIHAKLVKK
jgi:hypothetical protein